MPKIKTVRGSENRKVVSQKEWLVARRKLLLKEKKFSKLRDELNLQRRKLPWVKVEKEYVFDGPTGKVTLADLACMPLRASPWPIRTSIRWSHESGKRETMTN